MKAILRIVFGNDGDASESVHDDAAAMGDVRSHALKESSLPHAHGALHGAVDAIEDALAFAITEAAKAGRFDVVAQLAKELEARRLARADNVISLPTRRAPR